MKKIILLSLLVLATAFLLASCSGEDGAIAGQAFSLGNYFDGSCTLGDESFFQALSTCTDDATVLMHQCKQGTVVDKEIDCSAQNQACDNGKCVPSDEIFCKDSDGSYHSYEEEGHYISGSATLFQGTIPFQRNVDVCLSNDELLEFACSGDSISQSTINCPNGCSDGACIPLTCEDSDGGNDPNTFGVATSYFSNGSVSESGDDYCSSHYHNTVLEYFCNPINGTVAINTVDCLGTETCMDGACVDNSTI